jgi:hypothetical protein
MDTRGPRGERNIRAIVDDDPRCGPAGQLDGALREIQQRAIVHPGLADLNQIDASAPGRRNQLQRWLFATATAGHQTDDGD